MGGWYDGRQLVDRLTLAWPSSPAEDTVEPQPVLKEINQVCFTTYSFHSVTIQLEKQSDQRQGCGLCLDPKQ